MTRRSGGGRGVGLPLGIGGGVGGVVLLLIGMFIFGPEAVLNQLGSSPSAQYDTSEVAGESLAEKCQTGADANADVDCRIVGTVNSLNNYWVGAVAELGVSYRAPGAALASGSWQTGCGMASSATGPFYCSADETAYFDTDFFQQLRDQYGVQAGALPEEYVVAHEFGHHIQQLTGDLRRYSDGSTGPTSNGVRLELQADCYAGVWAHNAVNTYSTNGSRLMQPLTQQDIEQALSAARAIGDDRLQEKSTGTVSPDAWTHGSSEQRQRWFLHGYETGLPTQCDTFSVSQL